MDINLIVGLTKEWGSLIVSVISLIIAIVSIIKSSKAQSLQNKVNELELQLKKNELERIEKEKEKAGLSCVEARVISMGAGKYRLKVWNSGNTTVTNVNASFEEENTPIILDSDMLPYDELGPNKSFELVITVFNGTLSKFHINTEWIDINGELCHKKQMGSIR